MAQAPSSLTRVLTLSWVMIAIGLTVVLGPSLGLRGWMWLIAHHVFLLAAVVGDVIARRRAP